jgi:hypothetical protein
MLRKILGPQKNEGSEQFMILHNDEIGDLYSSLSIVRVVKYTGLQWAGNVARISGEGMHTEF